MGFRAQRINFFDWFEGRTREAYEIASEAGVPILAHGALRVGPASLLKEDAWQCFARVARTGRVSNGGSCS